METPKHVEQGLSRFVDAAKRAFGDRLVAVVLYGSAAEGALRPASDINTIVVLTDVSQQELKAIAPEMAVLRAAMRLEAMFLRQVEIADVAAAFPVKFADIRNRRRVLSGEDVFRDLQIPRSALIAELRQLLLNLILRTRHSYAARVNSDDHLVSLLARMAGPMRSAAAALLDLEGTPATSRKDALQRMGARFQLTDGVVELSVAREQQQLPEGKAEAAIFSLLELAQRMLQRLGEVQG